LGKVKLQLTEKWHVFWDAVYICYCFYAVQANKRHCRVRH